MNVLKKAAFFLLTTLFFSVVVSAGSEEVNNGGMSFTAYEIEAATSPEAPRLPAEDADWSDPVAAEAADAWFDALEARRSAAIDDPEGFYRFTGNTARALLSEDMSNRVYSPLSLWLELDILTRLSAGESRAQLLETLCTASMESLAAQRDSLWKSQYWDDGDQSCAISASVWLDQAVSIRPEIKEALGAHCAASVFQGDMSSPGYNQALRDWLNLSTRGLLSDAVSSLRFEDEARMSAATAIYYRGRWVDAFSKADTKPGMFHGAERDVETDFMHEAREGTLYHGEHFSAFAKDLGIMGKALFVLPEPAGSPRELLKDDEVYRLISGMDAWEQREEALVRFAMPRLDCRGQISLRSALEQMGLEGLFDETKADFSEALSGDKPIHLSSMLQISRIVMDEEGVEAAAITVSDVFGALVQKLREVDFTLDRPFLFALLGSGDVPLFMGVVNQL